MFSSKQKYLNMLEHSQPQSAAGFVFQHSLFWAIGAQTFTPRKFSMDTIPPKIAMFEIEVPFQKIIIFGIHVKFQGVVVGVYWW